MTQGESTGDKAAPQHSLDKNRYEPQPLDIELPDRQVPEHSLGAKAYYNYRQDMLDGLTPEATQGELHFPPIEPIISDGMLSWLGTPPERFAPATTDDLTAIYRTATTLLDQVPVEQRRGNITRHGRGPQDLTPETIEGRTIHLRTRDGRIARVESTEIIAPYRRGHPGIRISLQLNPGEQPITQVLPLPTTAEAAKSAEPVTGAIDSQVTAGYILEALEGAHVIPRGEYEIVRNNLANQSRPGSHYDPEAPGTRELISASMRNWRDTAIRERQKHQSTDSKAA